MTCVLFAKMDQVFSEKNKTLKKIQENWKKNSGKVREFCQSGKVGTLPVGGSHIFLDLFCHTNGDAKKPPPPPFLKIRCCTVTFRKSSPTTLFGQNRGFLKYRSSCFEFIRAKFGMRFYRPFTDEGSPFVQPSTCSTLFTM